MCAALDLSIAELKRIRVMNIKLEGLESGNYRELKGSELSKFLKSLGL